MVEGGMQEWKGCATKCFAFCHYKSESRFKMPLNPGIPTSDSGEEKKDEIYHSTDGKQRSQTFCSPSTVNSFAEVHGQQATSLHRTLPQL